MGTGFGTSWIVLNRHCLASSFGAMSRSDRVPPTWSLTRLTRLLDFSLITPKVWHLQYRIKPIVALCRDFRPLVGRQGTIVWAHPFLVHSASVNSTDRLRIISNTSVMKLEPLRLSGEDVKTPLEQSILNALHVDEFDFQPSGDRSRVDSERARRWRTTRDQLEMKRE